MAQVPVQQTVFVEVNTENTGLHQFRHASELTKEAKGGYLSGTIRICGLQEGIKIREITLSLVQDKEGCIHPGVLHVTPTERKERKSVKSTKKADNQGMRAEDFQVKLIFEDPGMIFVQTSYLKDRARLDVSDCWNSETRTLDLDHDKLQLTVVKPKQKSQPKPDDDLFIINVLKNKYKAKFGTTDDVAMAKLASEFTSGRGGNGGRETTLFKVFLSATCLVSDCQTPYIGICPKPIYDKGKYELKIKDILPPIICNEMGHKISIVFEKTTGDVPAVFRLLDENHDVVAEAVVKEKSGNVVKIGFDEILPLGCFLLDVTIQEGLDIIPASNQTFWVQVLQHQETNCYPCKCVEMNRNSDPQVANGNRGKRKNDASGCVDPKRRFSSVSRHASSPSNASPLSSDDNRSPNAYQEGNGQFTTSPYQGSPGILAILTAVICARNYLLARGWIGTRSGPPNHPRDFNVSYRRNRGIFDGDLSTDNLIRRRARRHRSPSCDSAEEGIPENEILQSSQEINANGQWKRILLLVIAVTVHNIPEGLAVGVGFGAVGKSATATFESARNLAIGIGLQNFPEGLAVSLPLKAAGFSAAKSIWYGQLSGLVEPVAGVLGALLVTYMEPILPYSLGFAAGAMVYVVIDDIVPEAQTCGNGKLASWGGIIGFVVMMCLDVGLG